MDLWIMNCKVDNDNIIEWFLSNFEVYSMYEYYLY